MFFVQKKYERYNVCKIVEGICLLVGMVDSIEAFSNKVGEYAGNADEKIDIRPSSLSRL